MDECEFLMGFAVKELILILRPSSNNRLGKQPASQEFATVVATICVDGSRSLCPAIIFVGESNFTPLIHKDPRGSSEHPQDVLIESASNGWTD